MPAAGPRSRTAQCARSPPRRRLAVRRPPAPSRASTIRRMPEPIAQRAVVTGLGAVTPIGNDFPTYWSNLVAGVTGRGRSRASTRRPRGADRRRGQGLRPDDRDGRKMARRMSRFIHFAMAAGRRRSRLRARLRGDDPGAARPRRRRRQHRRRRHRAGHRRDARPRQEGPAPRQPVRGPGAVGLDGRLQLSMEYGLTGPVMTQVAACATSVIAFHDALRLIRPGECDVVVAGGSEAPILPIAVAALAQHDRAVEAQRRPADGVAAVRPTRDGFVLGEGGGVVVVESLEHARGARRDASWPRSSAAALTADAFHITAPEPTGRGAAMAMTKAMRDADVAPDEIDYIVAHGTSTPLNDVTETRAIKAAFGEACLQGRDQLAQVDGRPPGRRGRASPACSPAIGAIRDQVIPPTINLRDARPGVRPRLRPAHRSPGQGRHGRGGRLRVRRPERRRDLPARHRLTIGEDRGYAPRTRWTSRLRRP